MVTKETMKNYEKVRKSKRQIRGQKSMKKCESGEREEGKGTSNKWREIRTKGGKGRKKKRRNGNERLGREPSVTCY